MKTISKKERLGINYRGRLGISLGSVKEGDGFVR
jgi:hypothetical protein